MSSDVVPKQAMVLAAGLGLRMRPISERIPKPLIEIKGRSMLDRALDALTAVGVERIVVNTHHLGGIIAQHLADRDHADIIISEEERLLETGGGIAKALCHFTDAPFFVVNGDILWTDGRKPALLGLAASWDRERMDGLLLLQARRSAIGYAGSGDFHIGPDGRLRRRDMDGAAPHLFAGLQILAPRLFADAPTGPFSLNRLYDSAISRGRLFGLVHDGGWCHVGTPADIALAENFLAS